MNDMMNQGEDGEPPNGRTVAACGYDPSRGTKIPRARDEAGGNTLAKGNVGVGCPFSSKVAAGQITRE